MNWSLRDRSSFLALVSLSVSAVAPCALGQYVPVVECSEQGGRVTLTFTGMAPNTCGMTSSLSIHGDIIDVSIDVSWGEGGCGDSTIPYCVRVATEPLRDGVYRVQIRMVGNDPVKIEPVVVACAGRRVFTPASLGDKGGANGPVRAIGALISTATVPYPNRSWLAATSHRSVGSRRTGSHSGTAPNGTRLAAA